MSIVRLKRVSFLGLTEDQEDLLGDLQRMGCLHLISLAAEGDAAAEAGATAGAREALAFLRDYPQRRRQVRDPARFDAVQVERQVLDLHGRLQDLQEERDFLILRIQKLKPWGDFVFPPLEAMGNQRLWFYVVPRNDLARVGAAAGAWEVVKQDPRFAYVAVVAEEEPEGMPVPRVHLGAKPRRELEDRLEEVELAIEDAQAERAYLTRWYELFRASLDRLEDRAALARAAAQTYTRTPVFALQGWAPAEHSEALARYAAGRGLVFRAEDPKPEDLPPTFLRNPSFLAAGEDLVNFYITPGYRTWDPSATVFVSFALFFGMILADAGYGAALGLLLLLSWNRLGRSTTGRRLRALWSALVATSLVYGALVGSYFGVAPAEGSLLDGLHLLDMGNIDLMMGISVVIGSLHVVLASVMDARRWESWIDGLASIGWACIVGGGLALAAALALQIAPLKILAVGLMAAGGLLVLLFTAPHERPLKRFALGLLGATKLSSAFGDVLSYLRLFALGMSSGALAVEFNRMAAGIMEAMPGIGIFFALLVLVLGHAVNFVLGLASAVIHGLRLNMIEFFNWGLKEEGSQFRPFRCKGEADE